MDVDPLELVRWCEGRMACFAVPRDVDLVEALPTNAAERVETSGLEASPVTATTWDRQAVGRRVHRG